MFYTGNTEIPAYTEKQLVRRLESLRNRSDQTEMDQMVRFRCINSKLS